MKKDWTGRVCYAMAAAGMAVNSLHDGFERGDAAYIPTSWWELPWWIMPVLAGLWVYLAVAVLWEGVK